MGPATQKEKAVDGDVGRKSPPKIPSRQHPPGLSGAGPEGGHVFGANTIFHPPRKKMGRDFSSTSSC